MKPWFIGNTTIRNPYRLRDGLTALASSALNGNLVGKEREASFLDLLNENGIVDYKKGDKAFFGRKWRSTLWQLGFISLKLTRKRPGVPWPDFGVDRRLAEYARQIPEVSGRPYEVTPAGSRLIAAESPSQQQECFLRAVAAYRFPAIGDDEDSEDEAALGDEETLYFRPLMVVLQLLAQLKRERLEAWISREEMRSIAIFENSETNVQRSVALIGSYRLERKSAKDPVRFDVEYRRSAIGRHDDVVEADTLRDYADASVRHLLITGLFSRIGSAFGVAPEKQKVADELLKTAGETLDTTAYLRRLWNGAPLPTDSRTEAEEVIQSLASLLRSEGKAIEIRDTSAAPIEEVTLVRLELEDKYKNTREEEFAARQALEWENIVETLRALGTDRKRFPDPPAYLEWGLWRAFLAIDSLSTKPWDCRRFDVDRDFLPMHTAPGNGPDMIFEFDQFVLVVEVTFTASSRQEAAEGEPVRRHVAMEVMQREQSGKPVYGLFIANAIDSNTAETFSLGTWYKPDDTKLALRIVPLTLAQFCDTFEAAFSLCGRLEPAQIMQLLKDCLQHRAEDGPRWKVRIGEEVTAYLKTLQLPT